MNVYWSESEQTGEKEMVVVPTTDKESAFLKALCDLIEERHGIGNDV